MIGDKAVEVIAENSLKRPIFSRCLLVNLTGGLPFDEKTIFIDGSILTNSSYYVCYHPREARAAFRGKPFYILCDLFEKRCRRYAGYDDFIQYGETSAIERDRQAAQFMKHWTNISQDIFDVAEENGGVLIPVFFDVVGYSKYIKELSGNPNATLIPRAISEAELWRFDEYTRQVMKGESRK